VCKDCAAKREHKTPCTHNLATTKSSSKSVVEEGGRRDPFGSRVQKLGACRSTQGIRVRARRVMPQPSVAVANEVGFRQR
jgi:hypothetical protein